MEIVSCDFCGVLFDKLKVREEEHTFTFENYNGNYESRVTGNICPCCGAYFPLCDIGADEYSRLGKIYEQVKY